MVAAELPQSLELSWGFDAFRDGSEPKVGREVYDGGHDAFVFLVGMEALHE